jgi:UTP--glucose-1-phosphate uridylyltransferase
MAKQKVRKAIIAAAGFGTRFLPQTKAMPKEMLPLVDKPIIQHVVEELVEAGIEDIIIVTGYHKRSIEDHFDNISADLRESLEQSGKEKILNEVKKISDLANFIYVRQKGPYGNGTPLLNAEHLIGNEPFIYTWADDFIVASPSRFKQLIETYDQHQSSVLAAVKVTQDSEYDKYGFAGGKELDKGLLEVNKIIEKPGKKNAPSDLATNSGYLFTADIFDYLKFALNNISGNEELYYNDALKLMLKDNKKVLALEIKGGKYYDAGTKIGYLKTLIDFALIHEDVNKELKAYLRQLNI